MYKWVNLENITKQTNKQKNQSQAWWQEQEAESSNQAMLPAGAQGFKCLRLWRTFSNQTTIASSDSFYPWMTVG